MQRLLACWRWRHAVQVSPGLGHTSTAVRRYRGPQTVWRGLAALLPMAVSPTDIAGHHVLGACRHQSIVASWDGLEHSPKWAEPQGHHGPGHVQGTLAAVSATMLHPHCAQLLHRDRQPRRCRATPHTAGCPRIPAAPMPSPEHPELCLQHRLAAQGRQSCMPDPTPAAGREPMGPISGRRMGTDTQSEGVSLLSHRHPPQSRRGLPGPASPRGCQEASATGEPGQDGPPGLPGSDSRGAASGARWAPAVPEGLSAGAERVASLLHDCIFRAGLCKAVVPSSSLSALGRWMSPGRTVPSGGWARRPPALHRRDPGYLASHSHW